MTSTARSWSPLMLLLTALLSSCSGDNTTNPPPESEKTTARATAITVVAATSQTIEVLERSVGVLESLFIPEISAEVEGRIINAFVKAGHPVVPGQVLAELDTEDYNIAKRAAGAEVSQLEALQRNQQQTVKRYSNLIEAKLISTDRYDEAKAQLQSLSEQLKAARERLKQKQRGLTKTRIISNYAGIIDEELISVGDFVKVGDPLFRITNIDVLRARLALPQTLASKISTGLTVRLNSPLDPSITVSNTIQQIRPIVGTSNRAIDVFTFVNNPGNWQPGASVTGEIILEQRENAVVVPETALVLRPAGNVVYVIINDTAHQRVVQTGEYIDGLIEITSGLESGETVALGGSGFLSDGVPVSVTEAR